MDILVDVGYYSAGQVPPSSRFLVESLQATRQITTFLLEGNAEYRRLAVLRRQGWEKSEGDEHFRRQRARADRSDSKVSKGHHYHMKKIAAEIHQATMGLVVRTMPGKILDLCAAPGGFLAAALETNPESKAKGFSLPSSQGGHQLILRHPDRSQVEFLDLTMLAADLGVTDIPPEHPEADKFLPRQFDDSELFDLVICDGNVLRTHERLPYREVFEPVRLKCAQLALGLEHADNKGAVLVLLHNVESWETVCIIYRFQQFSRVQLFKPSTGHTTRSSFYMIASSIKRDHPAAVEAISHWKAIWRAATFGTDDDLARTVCDGEPTPRTVLQEFGERLLQLGNDIWRVQADALTSAPFMSG